MQVSSLCVAKFPLSVKAQLPTLKTQESMATAPKWAQKTIALPPYKRGCHLVTPKVPLNLTLIVSPQFHFSFIYQKPNYFFQIAKEIEQDLSGFKCGLAHLFCEYIYNMWSIRISFFFSIWICAETKLVNYSAAYKCFSYYQWELRHWCSRWYWDIPQSNCSRGFTIH